HIRAAALGGDGRGHQRGRPMSALMLMSTKLASVAGAVPVYVAKAPQGPTGQYLIISKSAQENPQLLAGNADMPRARVSCEFYGASAAQADSLAEDIFAALKNVTNELVLSSGSPSDLLGTISIVPTDTDLD